MSENDDSAMHDLSTTDERPTDSQLPEVAGIDARILETLRAQHPIHALIGETYIEMGGKQLIKEWAEEYPAQFIKLFFATAPSMQPTAPAQGDIHLHVHPTLAPTALDRPHIDGEAEEVEETD